MKNNLKNYSLPFLIVISFLFLSVGYARVNNVMLDVTGTTEALILEEIYISDIKTSDENNAIVYNHDQTFLTSGITLENNNINSTKSFEITLYNNTKNNQFFEEVKYQLGDITYDNQNIDFDLTGLNAGDEIKPKQSKTFTITFKYSDDYKAHILENPEEPLQNELDSILNFYFGYLIRFYKGKGDIKPDNYYLASNSELHEIESEIPKRTGYIFLGWYDNENYKNGQKFYDDTQNPTKISNLKLDKYEIRLYARWEKQTVLPEGYEELTYIECVGQQYIDTGVVPKVLPKIVIKNFKINSTGDLDYGFMLNSANGSLLFNVSLATDYVRYGTSSAAETSKTWLNGNNNQTQWNKLYNNGNGVDEWIFSSTMSINGEDIVRYSGYDFSSNTQSILLIRGRNIPSTRFGEVLIYDDDTLLRDLIPCYRKNDGETGMYDIVEGKFYGNQGTGKFGRGETLITSEDDYQAVDLIISNGTQYIDTGVVPKVLPKIVIKNLRINSPGDFDYGFMLNSINGSLLFNVDRTLDYVRYGTSTGDQTSKTWLNGNNKQTQWEKFYNNGNGIDEWVFSSTMSINGEDIVRYSGYDFSSNTQSILLIRGRNIPKTSFGEVLIYDGDTLLRDLIPCYRKSNGEVGMFDLVERRFYGNQGTGKFSFSSLSDSIDNYQKVEYIIGTGTQYIDTGIVPKVLPKIVVKDFKINSTGDLDYGFMFNAANGSLLFNVNQASDYVRYGTSAANSTTKTWLNGNNSQTQWDKLYNNGNGVDEWIFSSTMSINGEDIVRYSGYDFSSNTQSILLIRGRNIPSTHFGEVLIYDGDTLLRDLIPCYRKSNDEVGMFDIVENRFYPNQGSGNFAVGPDLDN